MADFDSQFRTRFDGVRWRMVVGRYEGLEAHAANELQLMVQSQLPYVLEAVCDGDCDSGRATHLIIMGRQGEHSLIDDLVARGLLEIPQSPQSYGIWTGQSPWNSEMRVVAIGGYDSAGVLYGVSDFNARFLGFEYPEDSPNIFVEGRKDLDGWKVCESPKVKRRGLWTWGYVIYDYRRFIDNMVRLRLNSLTIWNDTPPLNIAEVIDYAHRRGIEVNLGFHWGWGLELDISKAGDVQRLKEIVLREYEKNYAHLKHDGIYFQTLTETVETELSGDSIATCARDLVNQISGELLQKQPQLQIQFGLHAMSVAENFRDLEGLDERVSIVWEDAGMMPFNNDPVLTQAESRNVGIPRGIDDAAKTVQYACELASLRPGQSFMMVAKGFRNIRWETEFENHRSFILGHRSAEWIKHRLAQRRGLQERRSALWLMNYPAALEFYKTLLAQDISDAGVWMLVEDTGFEMEIPVDAALSAAILWDPTYDREEYMKFACNHYYHRNAIV